MRGGVPAKDLADRVRVEDETRHSTVDRTQLRAGAAQERVEVVPPLPAPLIRSRRELDEPASQRLVFAMALVATGASNRCLAGDG